MPDWPPVVRDLPRASTAKQLGFAVLAVLVAAGIRLPFEPVLQGFAPYATFFLAILLVAWLCRVPATVLAVALSFAWAGFAVIPPHWSFQIASQAQATTLALFLIAASAMVGLSRSASLTRRRCDDALDVAKRAQQGARAAVWELDLPAEGAAPAFPSDAWPAWIGVREGSVLAGGEGRSARVHPDDEPAARAALAEALRERRSLSTEFRIEQPGLGERWLAATGDVLEAGPGRPARLAGITLDITERKGAEWERELLASIVASSEDAIVGKDLESTILSWNTGAERLFGYPADEIVGKSIELLIPPERRNEETEILARIRRGERIEQLETVRVARDGRTLDVSLGISPIRDHHGRIIGASKVARDIGDRKRVERALASQREWFRVTLTSIGDGVITADREGRVTFLNPMAEVLTGWSASDAEALPLREVFRIVDETTREPVENPAEKVIRTGTIIGLAHHTALIARDGSERPITDSAAPIFDDEGRIIGAVLVFQDVSEARRVERERAGAAAEREQLLESERLARSEAERANRLKDEFVATLSHELRTPLNAILGWTQLLRAPETDASTLEHALDVIERNTRAQAQLVSDLLDMSRMAAGRLRLDLQALDLADVVEAALDAVRLSAEAKDIRLDADVKHGLGLVVGDPARLEQILWNLLANAIKFTPRGGRVSVALHQRAGQAEIAIRDTGVGIKPDFLPHLFDRFRQGDGSYSRRFGGLGLGLAIVKQLADLHGAEVLAESDGEDRGAAFFLRLPLANARLRASVAGAPAGPDGDGAPPLRDLRILLVEDEPDTRALVRRLLEDAGAQVVLAADGREALDRLEDGAPDLLLSDIGLPGMDGYELLRRIRSRDGPHLPAVALTAFARAQDRARAKAAGYQSHLVKPVEPEELIATLAGLARRVRRQRGAP